MQIRSNEWYAEQAEAEYARMTDGPVKRAKVRDFISYLKTIDAALVKRSTLPRVTTPVRELNEALWEELAGPVSEERLREIEAMYDDRIAA